MVLAITGAGQSNMTLFFLVVYGKFTISVKVVFVFLYDGPQEFKNESKSDQGPVFQNFS